MNCIVINKVNMSVAPYASSVIFWLQIKREKRTLFEAKYYCKRVYIGLAPEIMHDLWRPIECGAAE